MNVLEKIESLFAEAALDEKDPQSRESGMMIRDFVSLTIKAVNDEGLAFNAIRNPEGTQVSDRLNMVARGLAASLGIVAWLGQAGEDKPELREELYEGIRESAEMIATNISEVAAQILKDAMNDPAIAAIKERLEQEGMVH